VSDKDLSSTNLQGAIWPFLKQVLPFGHFWPFSELKENSVFNAYYCLQKIQFFGEIAKHF
jgi:hypothetical protein